MSSFYIIIYQVQKTKDFFWIKLVEHYKLLEKVKDHQHIGTGSHGIVWSSILRLILFVRPIRCISFIISYRGGCKTHERSLVWFFVTLVSGWRTLTDVTGSFILDVLESLIRLCLIILNGYNTKFCFGNRLERFIFYSKYHKRKVYRPTK